MFSAFNVSYAKNWKAFSYFFMEQWNSVGITSCLKVWKNTPVKLSGPGVVLGDNFLAALLFSFLFPVVIGPIDVLFLHVLFGDLHFPEYYPFNKVFKYNKLHIALFFLKKISICRVYTLSLFLIMGTSVCFSLFPLIKLVQNVSSFVFFYEELVLRFIRWLFFYHLFH